MANYAIVQEKENLIIEMPGGQGPEGIPGRMGVDGPQGIQGIQGEKGESGDGIISSPSAPLVPSEGNLWFNQTLETLNVYRNTKWEEVPMKEELNGTFGSVTLNAGYF